MKKYLLILLTLSGCTILSSYQPKLAEQPKNISTYNSDLDICRNAARTSTGQALGAGLFGAAGALTEGVVGQECSSLKSSFTCVNECMASKGYKVVHD